jgi:hypothetical protein
MELLESFVWIAVGFVPMLCAMELAWRLEKKVRLKDNNEGGFPKCRATKIAFMHYKIFFNLETIMKRNVLKRILIR